MSLKSKAAEWFARTAVRFPRTFMWLFGARDWVRRTWCENRPGDRAWRGAALGLLVASIVFGLDNLFHRSMVPFPTWDRVSGGLGNVWEAALGGIGLVILASIVGRTPWRYRLALGACGGVLAASFPFSLDPWGFTWGVLAFSTLGAGLAAISGADGTEIPKIQKRFAIAGIVFGLVTIGFVVYWSFNTGFDPLEYRNASAEAVSEAGAEIGHIALPDPSTPGPYEVLTLSYGSGEDIRRPEFGADADLITPTVDGRPMLPSFNDERKNFWGFDRDELPLQGRVWYPGSEIRPGGGEQFPLVLIVHGNHSMYEYSDPGYEYLGELMASRGYIFVSVDENFINGGISRENDARGWLLLEHLKVWEAWNAGEDPAAEEGEEAESSEEHAEEGEEHGDETREHEAAESTPNPFVGKVDMSRIGLIGHSRGGEAVAVAAAFNTLPYYPDDATVPFDFNFDIGAVIAIAPVMGQYQPGGRYTDLHDVNYFVFHGANDGDVSSFMGAGQYEHVWFSGDVYRVKSALYVMGANHGQWNQVWGDHDSGSPWGRMLSTRSLISEPDQRKIGEVYVSAFLEAMLNGEHGYLPLFADARAGADWLPDTAYLVEFDDSSSLKVATFDEDVDVTTATLAGGTTRAENLTVWREQRVSMKARNKETAGVYLGWEVEEDDDEDADHEDSGNETNEHEEIDDAEGAQADEADVAEAAAAAAAAPRYVIELPADFSLDPGSVLFFSMADANESSAMPAHLKPDEQQQDQQGQQQDPEQQGQAHQQDPQHGEPQEHGQEQQQQSRQQDDDNEDDEDEGEDEDAPREPIDLTVRLVDADGNAADVPLSRFSMVQPQLEVQLRKAFLDDPRTESEAVFQSFLFPLDWFIEANPELDASRPARLEFVFDRSSSGVVILDTVGFRPSPGL